MTLIGIKIISNYFHLKKIDLYIWFVLVSSRLRRSMAGVFPITSVCICVWGYLCPELCKSTLATTRQAVSNREQTLHRTTLIYFQNLIFNYTGSIAPWVEVFWGICSRVFLGFSLPWWLWLNNVHFIGCLPSPMSLPHSSKTICIQILSQGLILGESKLSHRLNNNLFLLSHI